MKSRVLAIMLAAVMAAGTLAGCGAKKEEQTQNRQTQENTQQAQAQTETDAPAEQTQEQPGEDAQAQQEQAQQEQAQAQQEPMTARSLTTQAAENVSKIKSVTLTQDVTVDATIGALFFTSDLNFTSHTDCEYVKDPGITHQVSTTHYSFADEVEDENVESYYVKNGDSHILYNKSGDDGWTRESTQDMGYSADDLLNTSVFKDISTGTIDAQLADTTVQVNGREAYLITFMLEGEEVEIALREIVKELGEATGGIGTPDFTGVKIPATMYIYKDTVLPAKLEIDGTEVGRVLLESIVREQLGEDISSTLNMSEIIEMHNISIVTNVTGYDEIDRIDIPQEALDAQEVSGEK